jgi:hypothetical protein
MRYARALNEHSAPVSAPGVGSILLPLLLAVLVARLWLMPLGSSFWTDEIASVFVAQHGAAHWSLADVAPQAWRSWYYPIIHRWGALFGFSEAITRIPSVVAMLVFLAFFARLAMRLIHREAGWFAVFACLALRGLNYQAANARPYALGMCLFAAAMLFLMRWLDSAAWLDGLLFAACAASVLYVHLLFWPSCLVFAFYAAARIGFRKSQIGWRGAALVCALWAIAIAPVFLQTIALLHEAGAHVIAKPPLISQLFRSLQLPLIFACGGGAWLMARIRKLRGEALAAPALILIAAWWLCQPVILFGFSRMTGDSLFVGRYLELALPGAALAATAAAGFFIPSGAWRPVSALLGIGVLVFVAPWRELWPPHHNSDWRAAAAAVNAVQIDQPVPVICPSPFIEARPPVWRPDYPLPGFLYAQLSVYPIRGSVFLFPFEPSREGEMYAASLLRGPLVKAGKFLIYGWEPQVQYWREWFAQRPELAGWHELRLGPFADDDVVEFSKP